MTIPKISHTLHHIRNLLKQGDSIVFICFAILILTCAFGGLFYTRLHAPPGTTFAFSDGYLFDYYQYVALVRNGMMGHLLYLNRYTQEIQPGSLGHAMFPIAGMIGSLLGFTDANIVYLLLRILALSTLLITLWIFIRRIFTHTFQRITALCIVITSTSAWRLVNDPTHIVIEEPIVFSGAFNAMLKFVAPPQHHLALVCILITILMLTGHKPGRKQLTFAIFFAVLSGFFHPMVLTALILGLAGSLFFLFFFDREKLKLYAPNTIAVLASSSLVILYHAYLFARVMPFSLWAKTSFLNNYSVPFFQYVLAIGPILPLSIVPLLHKDHRKNPLVLTLAVWGLAPILIYPFALKGIAFTVPRLVQAYQFIPLSLLTVIGIYDLTRLKIIRIIGREFFMVTIGLLFVAFAIIPWYTKVAGTSTYRKAQYFNVFLPNSLLTVFQFLNEKTPPLSVVWGGEYVSSMVPAFTHNRVLVGRDDVANDYQIKKDQLYPYYGGLMKEQDVKDFLQKYHVNYILYGVDATGFQETHANYPFLKEIYGLDGMSVVQFIP